MASATQSELEKKEEEENAEELMDDDDEGEDGADGDEDDVEEDVVVQIGETYSCKRQDGSYHDAEILKTRMNKQAGREEFYVHYAGLNRRQNEWVDKTRLVIPRPVKEEAEVANGTSSDIAENGKTPQKRKNEEEDPEAKKVKLENASNNSAMASGDFAEELTCLLCSELFKDPVMVECGHNFCRNCIDKAWNGQESFTCPDCKEVITEKRHTTNRALANLVKKTVGSTAAVTPAKPAERPKPAETCPEHDERLKLYCKDDGTLSCVICRDSLKHASHNFLPILDAVGVYRTELSAIVAPLEEALKVTEQLTSQQSEKVEQHKSNVSESRQHIVSEFETLRTFLKERQEKLLVKLKKQGENLLKEMETNMVKLQENQDNIKQTIAMANDRMDDTDSICFLTGIKSFIEKCQEQQKDVMVSGNTLLSKDLCQGTFKGPIQYSIWKQLKSLVEPLESIEEETSSSGPDTFPIPSLPVGHDSDRSQNSEKATGKCHAQKTVWIVGHSYVYWAYERARSSSGAQLGLPKRKCKIFWFGQQDLLWSGMQKLMEEAAEKAPKPDILVIHAGGNDLTSVSPNVLCRDIIMDISKWIARWPGLKVIWSRIIQRRHWRNANSTLKVEKARQVVNGEVGTYVLAKKGAVMAHDDISFKFSKLYSDCGELLSDTGLKCFNKSLGLWLKLCVR